MYRNEYKASCSDLNKKTYCLGGTLRRVEGIVYCCVEVGEAISRWHTTVVIVQTLTTPRSTALSVQQQHQDLSVHLYRNNTPVSVQLLYMWIQYWLWSGWGVGPELVPRHHLQRLSWMDVYCGQWIGKWRDKPAIVISIKYSFTQTVCIYCSNHCDQSSLISPSR